MRIEKQSPSHSLPDARPARDVAGATEHASDRARHPDLSRRKWPENIELLPNFGIQPDWRGTCSLG
jgi:hypothetical protein